MRTFSMSAGLAASTVTPGNTAPVVSFTPPATVLLGACAEARAGIRARPADTKQLRSSGVIELSFFRAVVGALSTTSTAPGYSLEDAALTRTGREANR